MTHHHRILRFSFESHYALSFAVQLKHSIISIDLFREDVLTRRRRKKLVLLQLWQTKCLLCSVLLYWCFKFCALFDLSSYTTVTKIKISRRRIKIQALTDATLEWGHRLKSAWQNLLCSRISTTAVHKCVNYTVFIKPSAEPLSLFLHWLQGSSIDSSLLLVLFFHAVHAKKLQHLLSVSSLPPPLSNQLDTGEPYDFAP